MKVSDLMKSVVVLSVFGVICGYQNIDEDFRVVNKSVLLPAKIINLEENHTYEIKLKVKSLLDYLKGKSTRNLSLVLTFEQTCDTVTSPNNDVDRISNDTAGTSYDVVLQGNFSVRLTSSCNHSPIKVLNTHIETFQTDSKGKRKCLVKQSLPLYVSLRLLFKQEACSEDATSVFILELQDDTGSHGPLLKADLHLETKETSCNFDDECNWRYNTSILVPSTAGIRRRCRKSNIPNLKKWLKDNTKSKCNTFPERSAEGRFFGLFLPNKEVRSTTMTSPYIMGSSSECTLELSMWFFRGKVDIIFKTEKYTTMLDRITTYVFDNWQRVSILIGKVEQPFVLEIIMTLPIRSNGAIDNVRLVNCSPKENQTVSPCLTDEFQCSTDICILRARVCDLVPDCLFGEDESEELCGSVPDNARCSFENGTCGWTNVVGNGSGCAFNVVKISDVIKRKPYEVTEGSALSLRSSDCQDGDQVLFDSEVFEPYMPQNNSCQFRFSIYIKTPRSPSFSVSIIYEQDEENVGWHDITDIKEKMWNKYHIDLPPTTKSFQIGLVVDYNNLLGRHLSDILVDNLSLSPECFDQAPVVGQVLEKEEDEKNSTLIIALLGAVVGTVVFIVTALVIVTIYRKKSSTGRILEKPYRKISTHSSSTSSTTTSSLDDKTGFSDEALLDNEHDDRQLSIGRSVCHSERQLSLNGSVCHGDRHPSLNSSLCAMTISPYYEWIHEEEMIRNIPRTKIKLLRMIGKGAFGEVYYGLLADVAHLRKDLPVAIKTLPSLCSEQTKSEFFFEALILSKFKHPNITRFLGISVDDRSMFLILELMEGGDVRTFVRDERPREKEQLSNLTMKDLLKLATDIAKGCQYLECNKFIHRDIAARNCLLTEKGPNRVAKIGDFGMARDIFRTNYYRKNGIAMIPVKWMPSEAFMDGVFTSKTDVWAFGVVLWEIFTMGFLPYPGKSNNEVMKYVTSGGRLSQPPLASKEIYKLMKECWKTEPNERPMFSVIVDSLNKINQNIKNNNKITLVDISKPVPPPPSEEANNDQESKQEPKESHRSKRHHKHSNHSVTKATVKTCEVPV